jgi:hypothetical protein
MSTRAAITFRDGRGDHSIYRHMDGYPSGVVKDLIKLFASDRVWPLPRFESDEAAAGMIAMFKVDSGGYRLMNAPDEIHTQHSYVVTVDRGLVYVAVDDRAPATLADLATLHKVSFGA